MTDTMAAFTAIVNIDDPLRFDVIDDFFMKWQSDALVLDKWFFVQAQSDLPDTLDNIKKLTKHHLFDFKNPNRVYALLGSFGNNSVVFHSIDGSGYKFLAECVLKLDKINPQIAARMVNPLTRWKKHIDVRKDLMVGVLSEIHRQPSLSADVFELVDKSLKVGVTA